jgi:tetratricopeptide (TPR) repeat protein
MKTTHAFGLFATILCLSGCASFQLAGEVESGRQAWFRGNNEAALAHFHSAAQKDPDYVYGTHLRQGIWSYVGRSEYAAGRLPQARKSLERALSANKEEDLARLYLGLALARDGDRQRGLKEIEGAMRGIHNWLDYINDAHRFSFGQYWDPGRDIRSAIQTDLAMISGRDLDWQKLIAETEWLGQRMEEEPDRARRHEIHDRWRDSNGRGDSPR